MLIWSCCVFTEVAWITDEVWTTDEPFVVVQEGEISSWYFLKIFLVMCLLLYLFYLTDFLKTWFCSCTINLSKIADIFMLSVCDCIRVS